MGEQLGCRFGTAGRGCPDERVCHDKRRGQGAGQSLQPTSGIYRVPDDAEGETLLTPDIADDRGAVIETDADRERQLTGPRRAPRSNG